MASRGQTSVELLLVIAFTLVVSLAIALPYITNQQKTNAAVNTKLTLLPYLYQNSKIVKISNIRTEVLSNNDIRVSILSKGTWDAKVVNATTCTKICPQIDPGNYYQNVLLDWNHQVFPSTAIVSICNPPTVSC